VSALLAPTEFLDYESPAVEEFVRAAVPAGVRSPRRRAVALYYAVRDELGYEIYGADLSRPGMRASGVLDRGRGLCVHKSVVYAAGLRSLGIPSRLVLVDVRNHLASPRLKRLLGSDVLCYHGFTALELGGRWVKATPVFTADLCRLYRITPLDFDGRSDSVLHPADETGDSHMEVVREHGTFDDLPYELIVGGLHAAHPALFARADALRSGSLVAEAGGG
jgi:hypothetical protein